MKTLLYSVVFLGLINMAISVSAANPTLTNWPEVTPGSPAEAGFRTSLELQPPEQRLLQPEDILPVAAAAGDAASNREAPYVVLFSNDTTAFDRNGYYHLIQQEAVKILTRRGAEEKSTIRLHYDIPYDRTRVLSAYVIHPDGSVVHLTPDHIRDVSNSEDMDANIYEPIWRSLVLTYPGVSPGSIVYWAYENAAVKPRNTGSFQWGHTFRSTVPIRSARIDLKGPSDVPIHWVVTNNTGSLVSFRQTDAGDRTVYSWWSRPADPIIEEPGMIPVNELATSLLISTDTWQRYVAGEAAHIEPNLVPDSAIRNAVETLVRGLETPEAKLRALFLYVTKHVRYMGVAYGDRPGVNPDPVTRTFANNAGVCKDKAGLLTAMLRLAGIEAYYTLNNPEQRIVDTVAVDQFNHAIVAARLPGESRWRYLDVTSDLSRSMCPAYSGGTQVLRITPDGAEPETIPVSPPEANTGRFEAESRIDVSGDLISTVQFAGDGAADQAYRETFYYVDRAQWDDFFSYILQTRFNRAILQGWQFSPDDPEDLDLPVTWRLEYTVPGYVTTAGPYRLLRMPMALSPFDWFYEAVAEICSVETREWPANLVQTSSVVSREHLVLAPDVLPVAIPDPVRIEAPGLRFESSIEPSPGGLTLTQEFTVTEPRISPEDYPAFRSAFQNIRRSARSYVVLEVQE